MGVIMNYQKFMELVPKETKDFVFTVLKNYSKYEESQNNQSAISVG